MLSFAGLVQAQLVSKNVIYKYIYDILDVAHIKVRLCNVFPRVSEVPNIVSILDAHSGIIIGMGRLHNTHSCLKRLMLILS